MTTHDPRARMGRLDALFLGLLREVPVLRPAQHPLLYLERKQYILARHTISGLESARVALVTSLPKSAGVYMSG